MLLLAVICGFFTRNAHAVDGGRGVTLDTTVNAVVLKRDTVYNLWQIEWLKPIKRLRVTVIRVDGKKLIDQTFNESINGTFDLAYLPPGLYTVNFYKDNDNPFRFLIAQRGPPHPRPED